MLAILGVFFLFDLIFLTYTTFLHLPYFEFLEKRLEAYRKVTPVCWRPLVLSHLDTGKAPGPQEKSCRSCFRRLVRRHVLTLMSLRHPLLAQLHIVPASRGHVRTCRVQPPSSQSRDRRVDLDLRDRKLISCWFINNPQLAPQLCSGGPSFSHSLVGRSSHVPSSSAETLTLLGMRCLWWLVT